MTDPVRARAALTRAELLLEDRQPEDIDDWLREIIDDARRQLDLPRREW